MIEIDAHGFIGDDLVRTIKTQLRGAAASDPVYVNIASPGGRIDCGVTAYNLLRSAPNPVHARMEGDAFSAATLLVCAADQVDMPANALMMIHEPHVAAVDGTIDELDKTLRYLRRTRDQAVGIYHDRTAIDHEQLRDMLAHETYFDAPEALAVGLVTNIVGPSAAIANLAPDQYAARNKARLATMLGSRHLVRDVAAILTTIKGTIE
jgi:ATP-dependent Clp protease protease subunit